MTEKNGSSPIYKGVTEQNRSAVAHRQSENCVRSWLCHRFNPRQSLKEIRELVFWKDVVVEVVVCMFVECCVIWALTTLHPAMYVPSTTHFGLFAGFFIYALIEGYGPLNGAPLNPAGCWAFFIAGRISFARMLFYSMAEIGGAAAGAMIAFALTPVKYQSKIPILQPGDELSAVQGMGVEAILTFNLIVVALSVTNPNGKASILPSLPIAFCIGTGIMAAGTHTGGLQNPIVPFGPAVITQNFTNHWLYWVGPYLGATVGAIGFMACTFVKSRTEASENIEQSPEEGKRLCIKINEN